MESAALKGWGGFFSGRLSGGDELKEEVLFFMFNSK